MPKRDSVEIKKFVVVGKTQRESARTFSIFGLIPWTINKIHVLIRGHIFSSLDRTLLEALISKLPEDRRAIAETQIAETNFARRMHYGSKSETIMWQIYPFGHVNFRSRMFDFSNEEVILATANFKCKGKKYVADFILLNNRLFMIEYNRSTKEIAEETEIEILNFDLDAVPIDQFGRALPD